MIEPKSWMDVGLGVYGEYISLMSSDAGELARATGAVSLLCGVPLGEIREWRPERIFGEFIKMGFLTEEVPMKIIERVEIDGVWYQGRHRMDRISSGQLIDIFALGDYRSFSSWPELLSIVYLPESRGRYGKYDASENEERAKLFYYKMPVEVGYGYAVFFCQFYKDLRTIMQLFSAKARRWEEWKRRMRGRFSIGNGDGSRLLRQ
jgi:hypothetical protein